MDFHQFILTLPIFIVGMAAAISLVSFRYHYPVPLRQLSVLWIVNFSLDLAGHIITYYGFKNHWLYNIAFWIMYMALAYLYGTQIKLAFVQKSIRCFYILFPLLVIVLSARYGIMDLQTISIVGGDVFMIVLASAYFRQLYLSEDTAPITRDPWFWFSFGFLIHFGGTVPFLGMLNYLWEHNKPFTSFYYLYFSNSFTILLNLLIIAGFLCRRKYQNPP